MWHALVQEIHNGTLLVCVQNDQDWENARTLASFSELEQEEHPERVERELAVAHEEAARLNAGEQRDLLARVIRAGR